MCGTQLTPIERVNFMEPLYHRVPLNIDTMFPTTCRWFREERETHYNKVKAEIEATQTLLPKNRKEAVTFLDMYPCIIHVFLNQIYLNELGVQDFSDFLYDRLKNQLHRTQEISQIERQATELIDENQVRQIVRIFNNHQATLADALFADVVHLDLYDYFPQYMSILNTRIFSYNKEQNQLLLENLYYVLYHTSTELRSTQTSQQKETLFYEKIAPTLKTRLTDVMPSHIRDHLVSKVIDILVRQP